MAAKKDIVIAIDLMGGDHAPAVPIKGIELSAKRHHGVKFKLFGDQLKVRNTNPEFDFLRYDFYNSENAISSNDLPSRALRNSKGTSMRMAIEEVAKGGADAVISAGNTGALMAISKLILKTLPIIERPAICSFVPTKKHPSLMLDIGANVHCDAKHFMDFAIMGDAFLVATMGNRKGKIGILNIGTEDIKGHAVIKEASALLQNSYLADRYVGYVEPNKVFDGDVDIILTDGFTGNIFIKTAEGMGAWIKEIFSNAFNSNSLSKAGYFLSKSQLKRGMKTIDPRNYNGAMFVGLNGISIKSHGGTDEIGFSRAIDVAIMLIKSEINKNISEVIEKSHSLHNIKTV